MTLRTIILLFGIIIALIGCNKQIEINHLSDTDECPAQYELKDSNQLTHIRWIFFKNKDGHLYERTSGLIEVDGHLTDHEYFNGYFSQEVDPYTFKPLKGWYAVDKRNVYYYRPVSGGMQITKIENADVTTFKILAGHYKYAKDKNNFYDNASVIEDLHPKNTLYDIDKRGKVLRLVSKNRKIVLDKD